MAKFHTLQDDFNDNSLNPIYYTAGVETGGQIVFTVANTGVNTFAIGTAGGRTVYDLEDSFLFLEVTNVGSAHPNSSFNISVYNYAYTPSPDWSMESKFQNGVFTMQIMGATFSTVTFTASYNSTNHRWIRFRESNGTLYADYAGTDKVWHNATSASSSGLLLAEATLDVNAANNNGSGSGSGTTQTYSLDNLNINGKLEPLIVSESLQPHTAASVSISLPGAGGYVFGGWGTAFPGISYYGSGNNILPGELQVQEASQAHTADGNLVLSQKYQLAVSDSLHGHTADAVSVTQKHSLTVQEAAHSQTTDPILLALEYFLLTSDGTHGQAADNITLVQDYQNLPNDSTHGHSAESPTLVQDFQLVVSDASHVHSVDSVALIQHFTIVVQDSSHTVSSDFVTLTTLGIVGAVDSVHSHQADEVGLTQKHSLQVQDSSHAHSVDALTTTVEYLLSLAGARHVHTSDGTVLIQHFLLALADALQAQSVDSAVISQKNLLQVADALQLHAAETATLTTSAYLFVAGSTHLQSVDVVTPTQKFILVVSGADHSHSVDAVQLAQKYLLIVQEAYHVHLVQPPVLIISLILFDTLHGHTVDSVTIRVIGKPLPRAPQTSRVIKAPYARPIKPRAIIANDKARLTVKI